MVSKILRADGVTELASIKSVTYHESVNADIDLRPGCVASSYIEVTCFGQQSDAPTAGEELTYYQVVGDTETLIGKFYAEPSIPTKSTYSFIAYDAVKKLDSDFSAWLLENQSNFPYTVKQLVTTACTVAGVTLYDSSWALQSMSVNAFYADGITCRQIVSYAAEIGCLYAKCNANGVLGFGWYSASTNNRIYPTSGTSGTETRYAYKQGGLDYANYDTTAVARVSVHPVGEDDVAYIYPDNVSTGNTLTIKNNALLYGASSENMIAVAQQVYNRMATLGTYRPCSASLFPNENPFRAGKIVNVTDAQGVSFTTVVMNMTVNESEARVESTGNQIYQDVANDTTKQLIQLAADIVKINKLKVDWAEIGTAVIGVLDDEGITAAKLNGANQQEQLVYISKASGTTTQSKPSAWVTNTTGNQNTWTLKRPVYNSSYPVLFVATQRKAVDGTVTCTTPTIDQTTTVIDGGHITTGTIDASVVNVTNIDASNITTGALTVKDTNNRVIFEADTDTHNVSIAGLIAESYSGDSLSLSKEVHVSSDGASFTIKPPSSLDRSSLITMVRYFANREVSQTFAIHDYSDRGLIDYTKITVDPVMGDITYSTYSIEFQNDGIDFKTDNTGAGTILLRLSDSYVMLGLPDKWRSELGLGTSGAFPITIDQGGTGATTRANGQANFGYYTSVAQLNLTSSATMADIASAMPNGSVAVLNTNDFDATTGIVTPDGAAISLVTIYRINSNRIFAIGARSYANVATANARLYYAAWNGTAFIGWRKVLLADQTALAIGDGGTGQTGVTSTTTVSDIISAASGLSIVSATYTQWGKIAQINVVVKKTAAVTTATDITLGTLVSGKRPSVACGAICSSSTISHSYITTSGSVVANGTWAANTQKTIMATYILA